MIGLHSLWKEGTSDIVDEMRNKEKAKKDLWQNQNFEEIRDMKEGRWEKKEENGG